MDNGHDITFITGGARSGKSAFALHEACRIHGEKTFIATAEARDAEMQERIERHRRDRGPEWETLEVPWELARAIQETADRPGPVVVDCLTLWLANMLLDQDRSVEGELEALIAAFGVGRFGPLFIVSNEVGLGIVPENALARQFRDLAGTLNQRTAALADRVVFMVSGIPMIVKGEGLR